MKFNTAKAPKGMGIPHASKPASLKGFGHFQASLFGIMKVILAYDFSQLCADAYRVFLYRTNIVSRNTLNQAHHMKKYFFLCFLAAFVYACGGSDNTNTGENNGATENANPYEQSHDQVDHGVEHTGDNPEGIGKFKDVQLAANLDAQKAAKGKEIYDMKCSSCHKLTEEKLVGPGWKDVTTRRRPAWILNFITNVDEMIDKDKVAQGMLEVCMVRMPNQNLSDDDAFAILEFMRQNDGVK
jgi:cytochrome c551/c552